MSRPVRTPVQYPALEKGLIWTAGRMTAAEVADLGKTLRLTDFWVDACGRLWGVMLSLAAEGVAPDPVAVFSRLDREGGLPEWAEELYRDGAFGDFTTDNVEWAVAKIVEASTARSAAEWSDDVAKLGFDFSADLALGLDAAGEKLAELRGRLVRADAADRLSILGSNAFASAETSREYLVRGIMTRGEPCVIGGPKKSLKTGFCVELVVCLATASDVFGRFPVPGSRRVLFLSGESGQAVIQETARRVCAARGLEFGRDLEGRAFWGFQLPRLADPREVDALASFIRRHRIEVVLIDPLYLCLLNGAGAAGLDASNLFDVGPLLARVCSTCLDAGATPALVHHFKKGRENPYGPPELEDFSFAGVQEFARQWILISRRERYEPGTGRHGLWLSVGGSSGHSGEWALTIDEGVTDDDFRDRKWEVEIQGAADYRADVVKSQAEGRDARDAAKDAANERKILADVDALLDALAYTGPASRRAVRHRLGWSGERFDRSAARAITIGRVEVCAVEVRKGSGFSTVEGLKLAV